MTAEEQQRREARRAMIAPAAIGGGQFLVGLIALAVGVAYDWWDRDAGWIVVAALMLLGGPGFVVALVQARALLLGGEVIGIRAQLTEERDDRRDK